MRRIWTVNPGAHRSRVKHAIGGATALALTAGAAVAVPLLTTTAADAAVSSVEYVKASQITVAAGDTESVTVTCPSGKRVTGAGFSFPEGGDDWTVARDVRLVYSMPAKADDGKYTKWKMKVHNTDDEDHEFSMGAVCAKGVANGKLFKVKAKISSINAAVCAKDEDYIGLGGGFDLHGSTNFVVMGQFPNQKSLNPAPSMPNGWEHRWTVHGYRPDTSTEPEITVAVLCAKVDNGKTVMYSSANWSSFNSTVSRTIDCPTGSTAVAGGVLGGTSRFSAKYWTNGTSLWVSNKRFWGNGLARGNDLHPGYTPPNGPLEQAMYDNRNMFTQYALCLVI